MATLITNCRSTPCTELPGGPDQQQVAWIYIVSERTILLLFCMCDAIYIEQVLRGYGSNVSPKKHLSDCVHGESIAWRWSIVALLRQTPQVCQETVHLCARVVLPRHGVMDKLTQPREFIL